MSMEGWWMVQTMVRPVLTMLRTARMTMAAARASRPEVGSSMKMMLGLATSSTAIVSRLRCSTLSPLTPGWPTYNQAWFQSLMLGGTLLAAVAAALESGRAEDNGLTMTPRIGESSTRSMTSSTYASRVSRSMSPLMRSFALNSSASTMLVCGLCSQNKQGDQRAHEHE